MKLFGTITNSCHWWSALDVFTLWIVAEIKRIQYQNLNDINNNDDSIRFDDGKLFKFIDPMDLSLKMIRISSIFSIIFKLRCYQWQTANSESLSNFHLFLIIFRWAFIIFRFDCPFYYAVFWFSCSSFCCFLFRFVFICERNVLPKSTKTSIFQTVH